MLGGLVGYSLRERQLELRHKANSSWTLFAAALSAIALASCVHTQELPLAPNMVRIDTQASGLLFQGKAVPTTIVAAANATLSRG